jgi:hypothetical protein
VHSKPTARATWRRRKRDRAVGMDLSSGCEKFTLPWHTQPDIPKTHETPTGWLHRRS